MRINQLLSLKNCDFSIFKNKDEKGYFIPSVFLILHHPHFPLKKYIKILDTPPSIIIKTKWFGFCLGNYDSESNWRKNTWWKAHLNEIIEFPPSFYLLIHKSPFFSSSSLSFTYVCTYVGEVMYYHRTFNFSTQHL